MHINRVSGTQLHSSFGRWPIVLSPWSTPFLSRNTKRSILVEQESPFQSVRQLYNDDGCCPSFFWGSCHCPSLSICPSLISLTQGSRPDFQSAGGAGALCLLPATQGPTKPIIATSPHWTNTFSNWEKYILKLRQIHLAICTNTFSNLDICLLPATVGPAKPIIATAPTKWKSQRHHSAKKLFKVLEF